MHGVGLKVVVEEGRDGGEGGDVEVKLWREGGERGGGDEGRRKGERELGIGNWELEERKEATDRRILCTIQHSKTVSKMACTTSTVSTYYST